MRNFLENANSERRKWLAVILLGGVVIGINTYLESIPPVILETAAEFIFELNEGKLPLAGYF